MGRELLHDKGLPYAYGLNGLDSLDPPRYHKQPLTRIPYRKPCTYEFVGIACPARTSTTRALWPLFGLVIVAMFLLQALSCGLFFCVALPAVDIDLRNLFTEYRIFNQPQDNLGNGAKAQDAMPRLIPRIVHQTYRTRQPPRALREVMQSWARVNGPGWQIRFYDDEACVDFVRREFPQYLDAYLSLPKDVERSDFFRYMVVLRMGGVYADIDVELRQPLDTVLKPTDTLVVGWEAEVATDAEAFKRHFVRKRQVLQWFFAAAPNHPVLLAACEHIAHHARHIFSNNTNRDTLERTGPGMWTDAVLRAAVQHPPTLVNDPWKVRILPRVAFGVHPAGIDGLTPDAPEIIVLHHFLGSWKKRGGWHKRRSVLQIVAGLVRSAMQRRSEGPVAEEPITPSVLPLFPVSAAFSPAFTVMTHLVGEGDMQSGSDVSAALTSWGTWQAAMSHPSRGPRVVDALVGALGPPEQGAVLVDVSAGVGFFSLAAAARGYRVLAYESSARSIAAFSASIVYNGFQDRIRLYNVSLGAAATTLCLSASGDGPQGAAKQRVEELNNAAAAATRRGYGNPALHALPAVNCSSITVRQTLSHMLTGSATEAAASGGASGSTSSGGAEQQLHNASNVSGWDDATLPYRVGALRLSAHGWEGWILDGGAAWLARHRPGVVLLEYLPALVARSGFPGSGMRLLQQLYDLGYEYAAHSGYVCSERLYNISRMRHAEAPLQEGDAVVERATGKVTEAQRISGGDRSNVGGSMPQPTWCKLTPELFKMLTERAHPEVAENVLFIHHTHETVRNEKLSAPQGLAVSVATAASSAGTARLAAAHATLGDVRVTAGASARGGIADGSRTAAQS